MDEATANDDDDARPGWRSDLRKLAAADAHLRFDLIRALWELALAWRQMQRQPTRQLLDAEAGRTQRAAPPDSHRDALIARVAFAIPAMGRRVPWRSDCLVQALAARRWLGVAGITTTLHIGVTGEGPAGFAAHAWLTAGDTLVTGGETDGYAPLL